MINSKLKSFPIPFVIIGSGKSGLAAKTLLVEAGISNSAIFIFDEKNPADFNHWSDIDKIGCGTLVVSPGVPLKNNHIQNLLTKGWTLTSEITLASCFLENEITIGITGSVAKSTVTTLVGIAAKKSDENSFVGGNLGTPFCEYALGLLRGKPRGKWVVLELSSYQLENAKQLDLVVSAITALSPNHLERYTSIDEYYKTKCSISHITKKICILNSSSSDLKKYTNNIRCAHRFINADSFKNQNLLNSIQLIGRHNKDNFSIAYEIAKEAGIDDESINMMAQFKGLDHRIEYVGQFNGIHYINDSKATAMDSVLVAVEAGLSLLSSNDNLYLLLGGKDKNLPWEQLADLKNNTKIKFVFFGNCGQLAANKMSVTDEVYFQKMEDAVHYCQKVSKLGDAILLSPGGTSLDQFKNFEDRGNVFKKLVIP